VWDGLKPSSSPSLPPTLLELQKCESLCLAPNSMIFLSNYGLKTWKNTLTRRKIPEPKKKKLKAIKALIFHDPSLYKFK
jgi:hypothetical protein